jgi:butyryl-CoA dehydrogenase
VAWAPPDCSRCCEHGPGLRGHPRQRLAAERFEPFNRLVDSDEPRFDGESVHLNAATAEACRAYAESGMLAAVQDAEFGGMQLPCMVEMAANGLFSAASIGLKAYSR